MHERRDAPGWRIGGVLLLLLLACAGPESARAPHGRTLALSSGQGSALGGGWEPSVPRRPLSPEEAQRWKAVETKLEEYLQ